MKALFVFVFVCTQHEMAVIQHFCSSSALSVAGLSENLYEWRSIQPVAVSVCIRALVLLRGMNVKADSHIACRAHAVPLPCCAAKGLDVSFPFD